MHPHRWHLLTRRLLTVLLLALAVPAGAVDFTPLRARMVEEIAVEVRLTRDELGKPTLDERVLQVLGAVPRHEQHVLVLSREKNLIGEQLGVPGRGGSRTAPTCLNCVTPKWVESIPDA